MDNNEIKLEQVANKVSELEIPQTFPIFEIFVSLVAIAISMILFLYPDFMHSNYALYHLMKLLLPQTGWAILLSAGGVIGALGMLLRQNVMRIVGLMMVSGLYGAMAYCYIAEFPTIGAIVMGGMALFSLFAIPIVKYTGLGISIKKLNK